MTPTDQTRPPESFFESYSNLFSQAGIFLLGLISVLTLVYGFGATWFWMGLGALAWVVGLLIKILFAGLAYLYVPQKWVKLNAAVSGLLSSLTELGVAAIIFHLYRPRASALVTILAFGFAAGCAEILFVLGTMYFEKVPEEKIDGWIKGARASFCVRHVLLIERLTALMGHVGARGLVCLSLFSETYEIATIALLSFALTDGLAAYGNLKEWDWFDPITCRAFYGACVSISMLEVILFALFATWLL